MAKAKASAASSSVSASGKPKNFRIVHAGMAFPVGSVVPRELFPKPDGHLHIGSIEETTEPVNVEVPAALLATATAAGLSSTADTADTAASAQALRDELATVAGKNSELTKQLDDAGERIAELELELETAVSERDAWKAKAEFKAETEAAKNPTAPFDAGIDSL